jgi:long-chain acyl-CoA synthetase
VPPDVLQDLLDARSREHGDRPAWQAGNEILTWSQLTDRVSRLGRGLLDLGVSPGDRVAVALPNGLEFPTSFLAVASIGAVVVPLSTNFQDREVARYLEDFGVDCVITDGSLVPLYDRLGRQRGARLVVVERADTQHDPVGVGFETLIASSQRLESARRASPDDPVMFQLSSGSTGTSKQIARTHRNLVTESESLARTIDLVAQDRVLAVVPLFHTYGLGNCVLGPLFCGATTVVAEKFHRRETMRLLDSQKITVFPSVPFMLGVLAETRLRDEPDLSALRLCMSAGAPLSTTIFERFHERYGVPIRQQYGSTETGVIAVNLDPDITSHIESVGTGVHGVDLAVVDAETGDDLRQAGEGEVAVRSGSTTAEYFGNAELTAERFRHERFLTGDLGRIDAEGRLTIVGRKKIFINTATHKVDPAEVETLIGEHPKVAEVVVVGVPGQFGDEQVKAVIVLAAEWECSAEEILDHCRGEIADYKLPRMVEFRAEIPRNPMGKILRKYLQEPA